MTEEIFGPVLTIHVYEDEEFDNVLQLVDTTSKYALTVAIIAHDIYAIEKMKVLPGEGVDTQHFAPIEQTSIKKERPFTFLMSARLLKSKGIGLYADAARILRKKNYAVRFQLIGFFEKHHPDSITQEDLNRWEK